jgi:hypothetical protein
MLVNILKEYTMSDSEKNKAKPVSGEVIGRSILKTIGYQLFLLMIFFVGLFLVWAWWTGFVIPGDRTVTWWGLLIGVGAVFPAPLLMAESLYRMVKHERLILGEDRLQVVRRIKGDDAVILQIPYENIADLAYVAKRMDWFVGIDLLEVDDPNTFGGRFESHKIAEGWHYTIGDGYTVKAARIHKKLKEYTGLDSDLT